MFERIKRFVCDCWDRFVNTFTPSDTYVIGICAAVLLAGIICDYTPTWAVVCVIIIPVRIITEVLVRCAWEAIFGTDTYESIIAKSYCDSVEYYKNNSRTIH